MRGRTYNPSIPNLTFGDACIEQSKEQKRFEVWPNENLKGTADVNKLRTKLSQAGGCVLKL